MCNEQCTMNNVQCTMKSKERGERKGKRMFCDYHLSEKVL